MSRISHKTPLEGFDHVARLLKGAAGPDGLLSHDDARKLVTQLGTEGRKTEALAAENIFTMLDKRDAAPGTRVTTSELDAVRTFVRTRMLENRDLNNDGYSAAEMKKMSITGQALVEIGTTLQAARTVDVEAAKTAFETMVTPRWKEATFPEAPRESLPDAARREFDRRTRHVNEMVSPPIARQVVVDGRTAFAIAQFMHDSFSVALFDGNGKKVAHGDGWGSPRAVDWA
jgi:hypothetical protein